MVTDGTHSALAQDFLDGILTDGAPLFTLLQLSPLLSPLCPLNWTTLLLYNTIIYSTIPEYN